jgi:predicted phosphodiesterase
VRYGVLADVHANLHALDAVLETLRGEGAEAYLFAGDVVGYGAFPNECVEIISGLDAVAVAGNHDLIALGALPSNRCFRLARTTLEWTREVLTTDARRYLEQLPRTAEPHRSVLVAHGSVDDPEEYTLRPEQAARQLDGLRVERPHVEILILGHTHRPWAWDRAGGTLEVSGHTTAVDTAARRLLLNPGAVGQSRDRHVAARCMLLDLERNEATFYTVPYDVDACRTALEDRGLPPRSYHLPPSGLDGVTRFARRTIRGARRVAGRDRR